jgi:ribonucleoside-diphosphate reductase alpha chain
MEIQNKLISDVTIFRTYAKYLPEQMRRETYKEIVERSKEMDISNFPKLEKELIEAYKMVENFQIMPSMRKLQFAGEAIQRNNIRSYNCSYTPANHIKSFSEILYVLLCGTGAGYSVQRQHVSQLPAITIPFTSTPYVIEDSIEGWAKALDVLCESYFLGTPKPIFDYNLIRPKGSRLKTTGARAPGPDGLKAMLELFESKIKLAAYRKLKPIEVHDLVCILSDCVRSGGIRRSALISLFDRDDVEMLTSKHGEWWKEHPYRARANNSAVLPRQNVTEEEFNYIFEMCETSGSGEPGFSWTNDTNMGWNPCHEISLNAHQFCNLTTINVSTVRDKADLLKRAHYASLLGTVQAAYTNFPLLRPIWKETTEREALLGVSMTGVADNLSVLTDEAIVEAAKKVLEANENTAKIIGINVAARATAIKPEGTASCVLASSSGVHDRHDDFYIRRIRMGKDDPLYKYLLNKVPELCEDDKMSITEGIISIPQKSPVGAFSRANNTALGLAERAVRLNKLWVHSGYRSGPNNHNVSTTITVKKDEWNPLKKYMWENRNEYSGISLLPYDDFTYEQMPFESCDEQKFEEMKKLIKNIDLSEIKESDDNTSRTEALACVAGVCEVKA